VSGQSFSAEYSDPTGLQAKFTIGGSPISGKTINFKVSNGPSGGDIGSGVTNGLGIASDSAVLTQSAGSYTAYASCAAAQCGVDLAINHTFTIDEEDVILDYTGDPFGTVPAVPNNVTLHMGAAVNEETDGYPGSLLTTQVQVMFELFDGPNSVGSCSANVSALGPGMGTTGSGCNITVSIAAAVAFEVRMTVIDAAPSYYEGDGTGSTAVDVATPGTSTGGLWFKDPTAGVSSPGKVNVGFVATYTDTKKKTGARGNMVAVWRTNSDLSLINSLFPSGVYDYNIIVKSTSTTAAGSSLYLQECVLTQCYASFGGKATVKAVNRSTGASYNLGDLLGGNAQFQIDGLDAGEPGSTGPGPDSFAIRVWAAGGNIIVFDGNMTSPTYDGDKDTDTNLSRKQILTNGGNVQVHK
jgi:hypothetical protein